MLPHFADRLYEHRLLGFEYVLRTFRGSDPARERGSRRNKLLPVGAHHTHVPSAALLPSQRRVELHLSQVRLQVCSEPVVMLVLRRKRRREIKKDKQLHSRSHYWNDNEAAPANGRFVNKANGSHSVLPFL